MAEADFANFRGVQGRVTGVLTNSSGQAILDTTAGAAVAAVASANAGGAYTAAEQALINELKAQVNALLVELKLKRFPS